MKKLIIPENEILSSCIYLLKIYEKQGKLFFYRQNNIPVSEFRGGKRIFRAMPNGSKYGVSDLLILIPGGFVKVIFCEVKSSIGKQSEHQLSFQESVENIGAEYWLVNSVTKLQELLKERGVE